MYQMLREAKGYDITSRWDNLTWVIMYNPATKKQYTGEEFKSDHGIPSYDWANIKSIAGCSGDNIPGVPGVGEKTAVKYWLKQLTKGKKFDAIEEFKQSDKFHITKALVTLPFIYETTAIRLIPDELNSVKFENICFDYGFHSFLNKGYFLRWKTLFSGEL